MSVRWLLVAMAIGSCKGQINASVLPPAYVAGFNLDVATNCPRTVQKFHTHLRAFLAREMERGGFKIGAPGEQAAIVVKGSGVVAKCDAEKGVGSIRVELLDAHGAQIGLATREAVFYGKWTPEELAEALTRSLVVQIRRSDRLPRWARETGNIAMVTVPSESTPPEPPAPEPRPSEPPAEPVARRSSLDSHLVIAVLDVRDLSAADTKLAIDSGLMVSITSQLRVQLAQRGARVVDKGTMDSTLKKLAQDMKTESYQACYDDSCQIELGKALAATHILRSEIARFGSKCVLNVELFDLRDEVTVGGSSSRGDCEPESFLRMSEEAAVGLDQKRPR